MFVILDICYTFIRRIFGKLYPEYSGEKQGMFRDDSPVQSQNAPEG